jgi:SH3-like domain-containing protein
VALGGCKRLERKPANETVYVLAKQTYLRDRVAAVSNRVATVQNGDKLEILERGRRFLRVKTGKGEIGWIEEHAVVNPEVVTGFDFLRKAHLKDPVIATAVLRDDGYLHLKPGRDTDRYYLLPEGDKLQLLLRASVPKVMGAQASGTSSSYAAKAAAEMSKKAAAKEHALAQQQKAQAAAKAPDPKRPPLPPPPTGPSSSVAGAQPNADEAMPDAAAPGAPPLAPPAMEDWWLIRDNQGRVGWLMSRRMDVDVPDEIAGYAEGQRIVAAYLLRKVTDPDSNFPDKQAPEYVTVVNSYTDGLPYDFNQVRVFTWNIRKHRYETAFRQRNLQGYLPVTVSTQTLDNAGPVPTFSFRQGLGDSVTVDPDTGAAKPTSTETLTYRLDGEQVRKVVPGAPATARTLAPPRPAAQLARDEGKRRKKPSRPAHRRHH